MSGYIKSYGRYKELCSIITPYLYDDTPVTFDPSLPLDEEESRLKDLYRQFQRCRRGRESHRERCIPREDWDAGHQHQIDLLKQLERETEEVLQDLYDYAYNLPEPPSIEEYVEEVVPAQLPTGCELAIEHRQNICGQVPHFSSPEPLLYTPFELEDVKTQSANISNKLLLCINAQDAEIRACGQSTLDFKEFSDEITEPFQAYVREAQAYSNSSAGMYEAFVRRLKTPEVRVRLKSMLTFNRQVLYNEVVALDNWLSLPPASEELSKVLTQGTNRNALRARLKIKGRGDIKGDLLRRIAREGSELEPLLKKMGDTSTLTLYDIGLIYSLGDLSTYKGNMRKLQQDELKSVLADLYKLDPTFINIIAMAVTKPTQYPYGRNIINHAIQHFAIKHRVDDLSEAETRIVIAFVDEITKKYYGISLQA
jgi:hypothetical protein